MIGMISTKFYGAKIVELLQLFDIDLNQFTWGAQARFSEWVAVVIGSTLSPAYGDPEPHSHWGMKQQARSQNMEQVNQSVKDLFNTLKD